MRSAPPRSPSISLCAGEVLVEASGGQASPRASCRSARPEGEARALPASLFTRWPSADAALNGHSSSLAPKPITSLQNERVKAIRALEMRKVRKETGLFVAEGASLLVTARDHGFAPETLVYRAAEGGVAKGLVAWALQVGRGGLGGLGGRSRQARLQGQPAKPARRLPPALGATPRCGERGARPIRGSRWRRCVIPATWAPSSAPPMPSARRASSLSAPAAIPIRASACARPWAPFSRSRSCG